MSLYAFTYEENQDSNLHLHYYNYIYTHTHGSMHMPHRSFSFIYFECSVKIFKNEI